MVISSFISSILVLALGIWAYMKLESSMNIVAEKQLLIEPSKFSYKMWKDMPVTMYQSFTFFNLTNWNQVKSVGQKPRFVEVGPYVYRTIWTKSDIQFLDEERLVSFAEKKQWIFQPHLSKGNEDDQIWTINTPLMTALALIQNAPVITRNIVSVILDGLGEGAFIKRSIRSLLFEGYSDLIVSVGPLFDRRFANFNGKFAYLYNKNDSVDGIWTVSTGTDDLSTLNKITRFQSNIVNMTSFSSGQVPQGLNEVKAECASAWSLDQSTNGQLFSPFNRDSEQIKLQRQLQQLKARAEQQQQQQQQQQQTSQTFSSPTPSSNSAPAPVPVAKRFFSRSASSQQHQQHATNNVADSQQDLVSNPFINQRSGSFETHAAAAAGQQVVGSDKPVLLKDVGKFIFYPDLCRPIHLLSSKQDVSTENGIKASRFYIDPRIFMNSTQVPTNRCYEMNPRPALANALAATINSVTGANVAMPNLVTGASSPFAIFSPPNNHHQHHQNHHHNHHHHGEGGLFERSNHPSSFLNNALHNLGAATNSLNQAVVDHQAGSSGNAPISRLGKVRQLFSNIVSQRMSGSGPGSLLPSLSSAPALLIGNHFPSTARNAPDSEPNGSATNAAAHHQQHHHQQSLLNPLAARHSATNGSPMSLAQTIGLQSGGSPTPAAVNGDLLIPGASNQAAVQQASGLASPPAPPPPPPAAPAPPVGGSDRWITQFRFKWPRGVFSIGQCQLGAPIYASLPHFLDADEYYLEQVDGLKPNRSLHEFYIDVESTLHSIPVGAKARLQLNVATPELRFRNIPNAMIPVLWQEVTFDIDKPVATMLYWSFTMSATIYKLVSIILIISGVIIMAASFVGGFRQHKRRRVGSSSEPTSSSASSSGSSVSSLATKGKSAVDSQAKQQQQQQPEGQRSSWRPQMMRRSGGHPLATAAAAVATHRQHEREKQQQQQLDDDSLEDIRHGAALNRAFSSCTEFNDEETQCSHNGSTMARDGPSSTTNSSGLSPKQPSSRASSQCELVSSMGTINCAGCLLACLRHSPTNRHNLQQHQLGEQQHHLAACGHLVAESNANSLVRQSMTTITSDIESKATLSSRESNLDSGSSIYTQRTTRTFK